MTEHTSVDGFDLWPDDLEPTNLEPKRRDSGELWPQDLFNTGYPDLDYESFAPRERSPSAPIILLSAAIGLLIGMITFYLAYQLLWLRVEIATGVSLIMLFIGLATTSIGLTTISHSDAIISNLAFSCGLILLSVLFFGLCIVTGALGATVLLLLSG